MSSSTAEGKGKEREAGGEDDDIAGPYIMRPLANGLEAIGKAECVEVSGADMYVGTSHGHIVHYTVAMAELDSTQVTAAPERFCVGTVNLGLGGKRVEQILAFPMLNRLVVLCGPTAQVLSLPELRAVPGTTIKGVTCLSYDERVKRSEAVAAILCVARVRSIQLYRLTGAELRLEREVPIACSVAAICQYGRYLCVADTEAYKILDLAEDVKSMSALELFPTQQPRTDPGSGRVIRPPRPRTLVVGANEFMFLTSSSTSDDDDDSDSDATTLGVIVTALGEAQRGTLQFAAYPKSVVYDAPFLIVAFAASVDVYDTRQPEQTLAQRFFEQSPDAARPRRVCAAAGFLAGTRVAQLDGEDDEPMLSRAGRALSAVASARIVAVAPDAVYVLAGEPLPPLLGVDRLLRAGRVEEAVAAVDAALAGEDASLRSSAEARYCLLMAGVLYFGRLLLDDALQLFRRGRLDPRALLHLFPDYAAYLGPLLSPLSHIPMPPALRAAIGGLGSVDQLVGSSAAEMAGNDDGGSGDQQALAEALAANALEVLERYLEHCRASEEFTESLAIIDTALARLYVVSDQHSKFVALLGERSNHHVDTDMVVEFSRATQRHYYESLVHRARGEARQVLDIWRQLLLSGSGGEGGARSFGGMSEYIDYVEALSPEQQDVLLAEYAWLVDTDATASLRVLACLTDVSVSALDADRAMAAIQKQQAGSDQAQRALIERLIGAAHPRASHYLTYLLNVYVRQVRDCYSGGGDNGDNGDERQRRLLALETRFRCAQAEDLRLTFRSWIAKAATTCQPDDSDSDSESSLAAIRLRAQLIAMLGARPIAYDAAAVLACVEREAPDVLHVERAMLLAALGRISEADELLVTVCQDYAEAEILLLRPHARESLAQLAPAASGVRRIRQSRVGNDSEDIAVGVRRLLGLYLALEDDEMSARLVADVLRRYAECLCGDAGSVLAKIPEHWPYAIAEPLVARQLARLAHREQASSIERGVRQSLALAEQLRGVDEHRAAGPILLDYSQACAKCHKLLGSSAFVLVPESREIRHVSCG